MGENHSSAPAALALATLFEARRALLTAAGMSKGEDRARYRTEQERLEVLAANASKEYCNGLTLPRIMRHLTENRPLTLVGEEGARFLAKAHMLIIDRFHPFEITFTGRSKLEHELLSLGAYMLLEHEQGTCLELGRYRAQIYALQQPKNVAAYFLQSA